MLERTKSWLLMAFLLILIIVIVHYRLILNIGSTLTSWFDVPYVIWLIYQNYIRWGLVEGPVLGAFDTNAFFGNNFSMVFADSFIPQAIIGIPFLLFNNPILVYNLIFLVTIFLNGLSGYILTKTQTKNELIRLVMAIVLMFSPHYFNQWGHLQMISFWPSYLSFYLLIKKDKKRKDSILLGLLLGIQFLASVYLAFFTIFGVLALFVIQVVKSRFSHISLSKILLNNLITFVVFLLLSGVYLTGYVLMKKNYDFSRDYGEYVTYSAHVSDYMFTTGANNLVGLTKLARFWNSYNNHAIGERAIFPGLFLFFLSSIGIFGAIKNNHKNTHSIMFFVLLIAGLVFSFGPRFSFNGVYSGIPNPPYHFLLKIPFFDAIRATSRWSYLFYLALTYFSILGLEKLFYVNKSNFKKILIIVFITFGIVFEYLPVGVEVNKQIYYEGYDMIEKHCKENKNKVLLELPVTHLDHPKGVYVGLNYISKVMLASIFHGCKLVNGYSGYIPPKLASLNNELSNNIKIGNKTGVEKILSEFDIVKVNDDFTLKLLEKLQLTGFNRINNIYIRNVR